MIFDSIEEQILYHEGEKLKPYKDSLGIWTIGVGHNLDNGISKAASKFIFHEDLKESIDWLVAFFGPHFWSSISEGRRRALIDLRFNLGANKFKLFKRLIVAVKTHQWYMAAYELTDSLWWQQVQEDRRDLLYHQLKTGEIS